MYKVILIEGALNSGKDLVCNMLRDGQTFTHEDLLYDLPARTDLDILFNKGKIPLGTYTLLKLREAENKQLLSTLEAPSYIIDQYNDAISENALNMFQINHFLFKKPTVVLKNMNPLAINFFKVYGKEYIDEVIFMIINRDYFQAILSEFVEIGCDYNVITDNINNEKYIMENPTILEHLGEGINYTYDFYDILNSESHSGILSKCTRPVSANAYFTIQEKNNFLKSSVQGKFTEEDFNRLKGMVIEAGIPFNDLSFEVLFQGILFEDEE